MSGRLSIKLGFLSVVIAVTVMSAVLSTYATAPGPGEASARAAEAQQEPLWVNDLVYGSAGGGFYWDPMSSQVWTAERGWHFFGPTLISDTGPLWVNQLTYGSVGGGFYLDPLSGQVWTAERSWHTYGPLPLTAGAVAPSPRTDRCFSDLNIPSPDRWSAKPNLVLLVHGYTGRGQDMEPIATAVRSFLGTDPNWDVQSIDWQLQASEDVSGPLPPSVGPAQKVGACIASAVSPRGYENVHIIAHSLGAWVTDALVHELSQNGSHTSAFVTLLDAYDGHSLNGPHLGQDADFSEQYYHPDGDVPFTQTPLANGCNYDLGGLAPSGLPLFDSHSFPIRWYTSTIRHGLSGNPGFPQSPEYRDKTDGSSKPDHCTVEWKGKKLSYEVSLTASTTSPKAGDKVTLTAETNHHIEATQGAVLISIGETDSAIAPFSPCTATPCTADVAVSTSASRQYRAKVITRDSSETLATSNTVAVTWSNETEACNATIVLYEHINFGGRCEGFNGDDSSLVGHTIGNDAASSVKIRSGYRAVLFQDVSYGGSSWCFDANESDFTRYSGLNDIASSLKMQSGTCASTPDPTPTPAKPCSSIVNPWDAGSCPNPPPPSGGPVTVTISTNKSSYQVGESIRVCYTVSRPGNIVITDTLADGRSNVFLSGYDDGSGDCVNGTVDPPTGTERLRIDFVQSGVVIATATASFTVTSAGGGSGGGGDGPCRVSTGTSTTVYVVPPCSWLKVGMRIYVREQITTITSVSTFGPVIQLGVSPALPFTPLPSDTISPVFFTWG